MSQNRIILPGQMAPGAPRHLLVPAHVAAQRRLDREREQAKAQREHLRLTMVNRAQEQLQTLAEKSARGETLTPEEAKERKFLCDVATGGGNRRERRRHLRAMGLLSAPVEPRKLSTTLNTEPQDVSTQDVSTNQVTSEATPC